MRDYIPTEVKSCAQCGVKMVRPPRYPLRDWRKRKWCSKACMDAGRKPVPMTCQRCGVEFIPTSIRKRGNPYCSIPCANTGKPIKGPYRKVRHGDRVRTVHRVNMETSLGRPLTADEIVHHADEDKQNNDPSNLEVTTMPEHSRHHMLGNQHARRSTSGS